MEKRTTDPDIPGLLRTAGWLWLGYLAALMLIDLLLYQAMPGMLFYYLVNGLVALAFLGLAYWNGLQHHLKKIHLPGMLALITALPLVLNNLLTSTLHGGSLSSPEGMALRQLPILFVALVITAWQYGLAGVIVFSGATVLVDLLMVIFVAPLFVFVASPPPGLPDRFSPTPFNRVDVFIFLTLVRTVSFVLVGVFLSRMIARLHAQQASLSEANTRLSHYAGTLESLTISRERNRLAHELHDTLAHSLTAISVQLETVKAYWSIDRKKSRQLVEQSLSATRSGLEETRRALRSLRATPLETLGLRLALLRLAENAADRASLDLDIHLPEELPVLSPGVEQCIYRIAQEATENTLRHAGAKTLLVELLIEGELLRLTIQDDGRGFIPGVQNDEGHFGLSGMRERAGIAGGTLKLQSSPGCGTTLTLEIGTRP